jgi:peroxiredoxin
MKSMRVTAICLILAAGIGFAQEDALKKAYELYDKGKYEEALGLVDKAIVKDGETNDLLQAKYDLLSAMKKYSDAIEIALKKEEKAEKKKPWNCLEIVECSLYLKKSEQALDWLAKAVDRGYIDYQDLRTEKYDLVRNDNRFKELDKRIQETVGIDKPARDFTLPLLDGKTFTLSGQKGKVVLVDFWATWCGSCREEMPNVKSIHAEFAGKGLEIIGVSLDKDLEKLKSYIKENDIGWSITFSGQSWADPTVKLYGVNSIPSMWLVDRDGILRHFGLQGEPLKKAIAEMLKSK